MAGDRLPGWPRVLRAHLAAAYLGMSASSLHALVAAGDLPPPVRITGKIVVWLRDDLDGWLDRRAGRGPASAPGDDWSEALSGGTRAPSISANLP